MDLNKLFFDHQIALIGAATGPASARADKRAAAATLAGQIDAIQSRAGAIAAGLCHGARAALQCPTHAGCMA